MNAVSKGDRKLNLAQWLTTALSSENERLGGSVSVLHHDAKLLTGDVLLVNALFLRTERLHSKD